jgi:cytoskeletal protein CcmA (bactofilin family)
MKCPTEFTCAQFTDGELPEVEARELARHLEACVRCESLVTALRGESRMLVQCLQDIDSEAFSEVPETVSAASQAISLAGFALGVIGIALAFRLSTSILFGLQLPSELEWLNPRQWILNIGLAVDAAAYAIQNADLVVTGAVQTTVLFTFGAAVLLGMARVLKRSHAASSIFAVLLVIGLSSSPSYAIDMRKGAAASIPATETIDDSLMAAPDDKAKNIDIAGTIKGDLMVFGDLVTISGTVEGNVLAFARRVEVSGTVGGTLIVAGPMISVSGRIGRNLIAAGSSVNLAKSAEIGGNVISASSDCLIEGKTARDLITAAGTLDIRGDVARNVLFAGGQVALTGTSHIGGDLRARVQKEENVQIATGAVIGGQKNISLNQATPRPSRYLSLRYYVWQFVRILAAFVTGLILFKLLPSLVPSRIVSGMDWLKAGGIGFITLVTVPVAVFIVAITVIGLPIALLSLALWAAGIYFAKIVVAEFVGRSVMKSRGAVSLLAGLFLVIFAVNLPWIGGLINFLLILAGLGAIAVTIYKAGFQRQPVEL